MRHSIVSIVIGPLMLIGVLHAAAGQSLPTDRPVRLAVSSEATADRDMYIRKAQDDIRDWQQKLFEFGEKAKIEGQKDSTAVESDLNRAWAKTKTEAGRLERASANDWQSAKVSYEKAARELRDDWRKIDGESK